MAKQFKDLSEREILALAVSLEEEDARILGDLAEGVREDYPATARMLEEMREQEVGHKTALIDLHRERFGDHIPLIRRQDVSGFVSRTPMWLVRPLGLAAVRKQVQAMEEETERFYTLAGQKVTDASIRKLLGQLAEAERAHHNAAGDMQRQHLTDAAVRTEDETHRRTFVLQIVQPGLAGLMDGSVSTLAPLFAAAFATHKSWDAFLVGLAASLGAGISMGFAEALSDDGAITGRGKPVMRGVVCGVMTTAGGIGHTLPYMISDFKIATGIAFVVVIIELIVISWIRQRYMDTPFLRAAMQVILGGALVFATGVLIGNS